MTSDADAATYGEITVVSRETFKMVGNECYADAQATSTRSESEVDAEVETPTKDGEKAPFKYRIMFCLAVTVMGVLIIAISAVLIFIVSGLKSDIAALQQELSTFQHNSSRLSEDDRNVVTSVNCNTEELMKLQQNYSQLLNKIENNTELYFDVQQLIAKELSENISHFYSEVQQLRSEFECAFIATSCSDLPSSCPSGYYLTCNSSAVRVYCDMTLSCGNITGGWMRVAELNMTDTSQQCPGDLVERNESGIRQCRIGENRCFSVYYSTADVSYSRVCGRITAYQVGSTNAFRQYYEK